MPWDGKATGPGGAWKARMLVSLRPNKHSGKIWNRNDRHAEIPEGAGRLLEGPERLSAHNARFRHKRRIERSVEATIIQGA